MNKTIEIPDIAQYEETDSELAKYTIQQLQHKIKEYEDRIKKAIKKLNSAVDHYEDLSTDWALKCTIKILKGEEIEIPQFEGTLEQLDKLSIRGKDEGNTRE